MSFLHNTNGKKESIQFGRSIFINNRIVAHRLVIVLNVMSEKKQKKGGEVLIRDKRKSEILF